MTSIAATTIAPRISSAPSSKRAYPRRTNSKPRLTNAVIRPSFPCGCTKRELMTGDSVTATMPDNDDRGRQRHREFEEQRAGQTALEADRRVDGRQRDRHRDDRAEQLARADQRRLDPGPALTHVPLDVLDHDDRVVDDETDRQDDREQSSAD